MRFLPIPRFPITTVPVVALVALSLFPEIASAADKVWTVYAYGSGNVLRQIFEGMKGFVEDEGYKQMIFVLLLLMMIFTLIKGFIFNRPSPVPIVGLILAAFILNIALFSRASRADIHIEDQVHGEDYLVEDVPLVLAGASALTSEMSRYMVKLVEAFYMGPSIPQELMMSNNNTYNFTNKIMSALKNVNLSEPHTKATFNSYMRECVVPEMYQGRIRLDGLLNAEPQDFWNSISVGNQARMSVCFQACQAAATPDTICNASECPNPYGTGSASGTSITAREWRGGMMVACDEGHTKLGERITTLIGASAFNQLGNTLLRDTSVLDGVISSSVTHIPVLTYGMVKGGEFALTQIATEASAPKASEKGASEIAGKSYSYGSIAANNFGANKFDGTTSTTTGYDAVTSKEGAGALTALTPESFAARTKAGSPQTITEMVSESGKLAESGMQGATASQSISADIGASGLMKSIGIGFQLAALGCALRPDLTPTASFIGSFLGEFRSDSRLMPLVSGEVTSLLQRSDLSDVIAIANSWAQPLALPRQRIIGLA